MHKPSPRLSTHLPIVDDWDKMGCATTQTHSRVSKTSRQAFDFLTRLQKLNRVIQKLG